MDGATMLREQLKFAHDLLHNTMKDVNAEQLQWTPPGKAIPIGGTIAHVVIGEDMLLNGMAKGVAPLAVTTFAGKTGLSEMPPAPGQPWDGWASDLKIDMPAFAEYTQAVLGGTDEYVSSLDEQALAREMDLSAFGMGKQSLAWFLGNVMVSHVNSHCGEVSCLKGLQGDKGYPF